MRMTGPSSRIRASVGNGFSLNACEVQSNRAAGGSLAMLMPTSLRVAALPRPPAWSPHRAYALRDPVERHQGGPVPRTPHQVADQVDRFELRIDDIHARRVAQEVEHRPLGDAPLQRLADHL